jgi:hypothetical protein
MDSKIETKKENTNTYTNNTFQIYTKLTEIYGKERKEHVEDKIEPIYENMRSKFIDLYSSEPEFFIRIPYLNILLGDNVTNLFNDKVVTSSEKDFIICGRTIDKKTINIELFDLFNVKTIHDLDSSVIEDYQYEHLKYIILAYKASINNIKPKTVKGVNMLINFNISNIKERDKLVTCFVAAFFSGIYCHKVLDKYNKKTIYELCINELNKVGNFTYYNSNVYYQLFLERDNIGIFQNNTYLQMKIDDRYII